MPNILNSARARGQAEKADFKVEMGPEAVRSTWPPAIDKIIAKAKEHTADGMVDTERGPGDLACVAVTLPAQDRHRISNTLAFVGQLADEAAKCGVAILDIMTDRRDGVVVVFSTDEAIAISLAEDEARSHDKQ